MLQLMINLYFCPVNQTLNMKNTRRAILFFLLILVGTFEMYSQYMFRHWDVVDGMSDNQIRYLTMTPDGRIAIRTSSILNIYNGATFEHFYHDRRRIYQWDFNLNQIFKDYHDAYGRIWMKSPGYLLLFDLNSNQFIYDIDSELYRMGVDKKLKNLFVDDSKNYWLLTEDNTFYFYDISAGKLRVMEEGSSNFTHQYGVPCELAQYGNTYYIVYSSGLIRRWDKNLDEYTGQDTYFVGRISEATDRLKIQPTQDGDLWLMYNHAVCYRNKTEKGWQELTTINGMSNFFTCMDLDKDGNVWVGSSWSGLRRIDNATHQVETMAGMKLGDGSVLSNDIQCLFADPNNGVWVGTLWQGICYYNPSMYKFKLIQTVQNETLITNESIRSLLEDEDGSILIGTSTYGVKRYFPSTGEIRNVFSDILSKDICLTLYHDRKKRLWIGTYLNGFYCIDGNNVKNYNRQTEDTERYPNQNISRAIYEDPDGRFWVSVSNEGVGELDTSTGGIRLLRDRHPQIAFHKRDYGFYPVSNHLFAVYGENGIYYYDTQKDEVFVPELDDPDNPKFMGPQVCYNCVYKDSRSLEWFGTDIGIRVWDEQRKRAYTISTESGLSNNTISSILEDGNGVYWVSTVSSISRIELKETPEGYHFQVVNFGAEDGLQCGKFYENSSLKTRSGELYFGGHHGVNSFHPEKISYNRVLNKPVFTAFRLFNTPVKEHAEYKGRVILENPINNTREIRLNYNENFVTFEFAGLNYVNTSHTYYKYKLENFDPDWNEIRTSGLGVASYTGLRPGKYKLVVYTANNDKSWGEQAAAMTIVISPPFWATVPAYIFYTLLAGGILFLLYRAYQKRKLKKMLEQEAIKREQQKEELNQMKFRFFTNISHEFRTPLTLIMTPLGILIQQTESPIKDKLKSIYNHANDLLGLINQLLDFRKLEMGGESLKLNQSDLVEFVRYIGSAFKELAANRAIDFTIESECPELISWFDDTKMQRILSNIYSNAFKFTPDGGHISTVLSKEERDNRRFAKIEISDTGCGISEKDLNTIFERFYQAEPTPGVTGSGIGLHMVKEYVSLHDGKIEVRSEVGTGTTFLIYIPLDLEGNENGSERRELPVSSDNADAADAEPEAAGWKTLLVVEDNVEFRHFLKEQLADSFHILEAGDGVEGEEIAKSKSPDLIISDMMMPRVDGLEMCIRLKNDIQTSHIPIILLTARISDEARIESYKAGADSYISKPFNFEILMTRIHMLLEQQEKRKEIFHKEIEISPQNITITSLDEEFVKKALQLVEENMEEPDFSVNNLCDDLGMSRSQLYRKFQSITGLTPNDFIRTVRLKRAAQLLRSSSYNISEISDRVGFNSIKYFNKYFKEEFGVTPTQYRSSDS